MSHNKTAIYARAVLNIFIAFIEFSVLVFAMATGNILLSLVAAILLIGISTSVENDYHRIRENEKENEG